jgi:transcriptional regulator with XRE-family HTH domain
MHTCKNVCMFFMELSKLITDKIINRLNHLRINRKEFAEMVNVHPPAITRMLSGRHNFTLDTLEKIQEALKISFFSYSEIENNKCFPCIIDNNFFKKHS